MRSSMKWLVGAAMVFCVVMTASAAKLDQGTQEINIIGSAQNLKVIELSASVGYGYYIASGLKLGGSVGYELEDKDMALMVGANTEYNFVSESPIVPFVGIGFGLAYAMPDEGDSEANYVITPNAGLKYFIVDTVSVGARLQLHKADADRYRYDDEYKDMKTTIEVDTRFYF